MVDHDVTHETQKLIDDLQTQLNALNERVLVLEQEPQHGPPGKPPEEVEV